MNQQSENDKLLGRLAVLVDRHLQQETRMTRELEELNDAIAVALENAGLRGLNAAELEKLQPARQQLETNAAELARARELLLARIESETGERFDSIREFVEQLPAAQRQRMDSVRAAVLKRTESAQLKLLQNQAALFYTYDFHRRYVAGVLDFEQDKHGYRRNGLNTDIGPGNLIRQTC